MAKPNPRKSNGTKRKKIRARWKAIVAPCTLCGKPIDYGLGMVYDWSTPRHLWRSLCRVFSEPEPRFVLKGGFGMVARVPDA